MKPLETFDYYLPALTEYWLLLSPWLYQLKFLHWLIYNCILFYSTLSGKTTEAREGDRWPKKPIERINRTFWKHSNHHQTIDGSKTTSKQAVENESGRSINVEHSATVRKVVGSTPQLGHSRDSKMVLDASLLNAQQLKGRVKGKWRNPGKGLVPFPTFG